MIQPANLQRKHVCWEKHLNKINLHDLASHAVSNFLSKIALVFFICSNEETTWSCTSKKERIFKVGHTWKMEGGNYKTFQTDLRTTSLVSNITEICSFFFRVEGIALLFSSNNGKASSIHRSNAIPPLRTNIKAIF